jgi:hypothetical protein
MGGRLPKKKKLKQRRENLYSDPIIALKVLNEMAKEYLADFDVNTAPLDLNIGQTVRFRRHANGL